MSDLTFTGKVVKKGQTETFGEKGFRKRVLVVSDQHEEYPQEVPFEFTQDKTELLNSVNVGDVVSVSFNLRGNEWNGKHYANVQGWKLEQIEKSSTPTPQPAKAKVTSQKEEAFENALPEEDDLPF